MKTFKNIFLPSILTIILAFNVSTIMAVDNPPNPPGGGHGTGGDLPPGGGAPIGGGTFILIALGAAYGAKKVYEKNEDKLEE